MTPGPSLAGLRLVIADHASGVSRVACASLVYMPSPLPRRGDWVPSSAHFPSRVSLPRYGSRVGPRIDLFEACSAFTRVTACTLALPPYFVARIPKASTVSLPPQLLRLLPAGASRRVGLSPTGKRRLLTAHAKIGLSACRIGLPKMIVPRGDYCSDCHAWPRICCCASTVHHELSPA